MTIFLCGLYLAVLLVLAVYGVHRSYLVLKAWQLRHRLAQLAAGVPAYPLAALRGGVELPYVTVQLPMFNEATVAGRLLDEVSRLEWPRDRLEIQVLDDSTDETCALVRRKCEELRAEGLDVAYLHREDRVGYKAGALDAGLKVAKGELVCLFDADFLVPPDFLRRVVPHFSDEKVAMVQTRWGHINRDHSLLTRVAALMLDGHHLVENRVRAAADWLFNFAGTGGVWRKDAIADAGGWQHDTLTEDLDLSYRAQLRGWKFVYRENIVTPAELPEDIAAFRAQQFRWAVGTVQTQRKLLRRVLSSDLSFGARAEAFFHLTPHFAYPLTMLLSLLLLPIVLLVPGRFNLVTMLFDVPLFFGTTGSLAAFYTLAERTQGRRASQALKILPALLAVGVGMTPLITRALFRGFREMAGEFVRTPKRGSAKTTRYRAAVGDLPLPELALCIVSCASTVLSMERGHWIATPFAALFAAGYGWTAWAIVADRFAALAPASKTAEPAFSSAVDTSPGLAVD